MSVIPVRIAPEHAAVRDACVERGQLRPQDRADIEHIKDHAPGRCRRHDGRVGPARCRAHEQALFGADAVIAKNEPPRCWNTGADGENETYADEIIDSIERQEAMITRKSTHRTSACE